jgi:hypothetical protein
MDKGSSLNVRRVRSTHRARTTGVGVDLVLHGARGT